MGTVRRLVRWVVQLGIWAAFAGLGIFGLFLMGGAIWYPTGWFWGIVVFLLGLFGVFLALGTAMTAKNRPRTERRGPTA